MQNVDQTAISNAESIINTPLYTAHHSNKHHPSSSPINSERFLLKRDQLRDQFYAASPEKNENHKIIPSEKKQNENKKTDSMLLERNGYSIYLINSFTQRVKVSELIKRMYASRGYLTESTDAFSTNLHQYTFEARQAQRPIGTLTLTIDTNKGLLADTLYKKELDRFRQQGHRLCEVSKLAFIPKSGSKEILAALFHLAYLYANDLHSTQDAFIEVNPRHALFYQRMLGFRQIGQQQICPRVNAPAVLLHLDLAFMGTQITTMAGQLPGQKERSIYPLFLPFHEEQRVLQRIQPRQTSMNTHSLPKRTQSYLSLAPA
ncbi:MAG: long-chain N-acyl amino acid synthase [Nitrosomonas sp.]|nr:long-chain N-acyl amino acid synthase [Nitrosomonas sp.]